MTELLREYPKDSAPRAFPYMQNRELSWLRFNERVLEEADNADNPLLERFNFLSIFTTNLDEFFMVRVGGLMDYMRHDPSYTDNKTGMTAAEQLDKIYAAVRRLYGYRDDVFLRIESAFAREGVRRLDPDAPDRAEERLLDRYFDMHLHPVLSPQIVDASHPFPHIENKRIVAAFTLETKNRRLFAMIPLPQNVERVYASGAGYILLEDIILKYGKKVFPNYRIVETAAVSITRNADISTIRDIMDENEDFREHMSKLLKKRKRLEPVRLEVCGERCETLVAYLQKRLTLCDAQTFFTRAPINLGYRPTARDAAESPRPAGNLNFAPFEPAMKRDTELYGSVIRRLRQGDILLLHPFESVQPFLSLLREASEDKYVSSVRITLYRIAEQSKIIEYLIAAAESGKDVSVFIELRARMDEENNIETARRMDEAGCHVFYGPPDFKLHAKVCLIIRREHGKNELITHIGTGNYNEKTMRLYTDISLLTAHGGIGQDAALFFRGLMAGTPSDAYKFLLVAPNTFKTGFIEAIREEARLGADGGITLKCNSLTDRDIIGELVAASRTGVRINLIIRGICCILPRVPGYTENISVRSVVGRFLEHSRIYRFGEGERARIFVGSGDLMTRNTVRRIELFAPVEDKGRKREISDLLDLILLDNENAREMTAEGLYAAVPRVGDSLDSQQYLIEQTKRAAEFPPIDRRAGKGPARRITGILKAAFLRR